MLVILYSFGAGLLGAACALAIFILWKDHQKVTAIWNFLNRPQTAGQPTTGTQGNAEKPKS